MASIKANYEVVPDIKMDVDYEEKEMTKEQKEAENAKRLEEAQKRFDNGEVDDESDKED